MRPPQKNIAPNVLTGGLGVWVYEVYRKVLIKLVLAIFTLRYNILWLTRQTNMSSVHSLCVLTV